MKTSQAILLSLVRNALWGTPCDLASKPDWDKVLYLARQQTVIGLVAEAVPGLPEEFQPDAGLKLKLHSAVMGIYRSHALLNGKLAQVRELMASADIRSVLFKGQGVALNYPDPLSRQCGDIDLYVGEKNFLKGMDILEPGVEHDAGVYKDMKHFTVDSDGVHVELHRIAEMLPGKRIDKEFQKWTVEQLMGPDVRSVRIGGCEVDLPPVGFDPLYIMNHAWHHFITGGIGLRQLCDWTMYIHRFHDRIDAARIESDLKRFRLVKAWDVISCLCVKYLGLPAGECPLYGGRAERQADKMLDIIFSEGNFGKFSSVRKSPRPAGHFAGKFHSFMINTRRLIHILPVAPGDVIRSWVWYFVRGMKNVNKRIK